MSNILTESQMPDRDAEVIAALETGTTKEVAKQFKLSVSTVRKIRRREAAAQVFDLKLTDGTQVVPIAQIKTSQGFIHACKKAKRQYSATFARLELPQWRLVAGADSVALVSDALLA